MGKPHWFQFRQLCWISPTDLPLTLSATSILSMYQFITASFYMSVQPAFIADKKVLYNLRLQVANLFFYNKSKNLD